MNILIVDDDPEVVELVEFGFKLQWREIEVTAAHDAEMALAKVEQEHPSLVLLDIALPRTDGYEVLRQLRRFSDVPVIMLTGKNSLLEKVKGLELGADDYVTKPFDILELLARVKAVLRRLDMPQPLDRTPSFVCGDLSVDFAGQQVRVKGEPVALTATEYRLLYHLVRNAAHTLSYRTLLSRVWGPEYVDEVNYLRVYIRRLRLKLEEDAEHPRYILTVRGSGYRFRGHTEG